MTAAPARSRVRDDKWSRTLDRAPSICYYPRMFMNCLSPQQSWWWSPE